MINTREPRKAMDRALLRANDPLTALKDIQAVRAYLDDREALFVKLARKWGKTWAEIAATAGISGQAAWERWQELEAAAPR